MENLLGVLGFLLLASGLPLQEAKRFRDVLGHEQSPGHVREHNQLRGWSSDETEWNENLYPVWKRGDGRWKNSWEGGRVQAVLTSDSPALVGSNITFVVNLVFPRCQKEDADGNIIYEKNCRNDLGFTSDRSVYNWTAGAEGGDWEGGTGQSQHLAFPDGKPFPRPHGWKKWSFVYVFHTLGLAFTHSLSSLHSCQTLTLSSVFSERVAPTPPSTPCWSGQGGEMKSWLTSPSLQDTTE